MSSENIKTEEEPVINEISKGARLRLARDAKGLEASEVAAKLYFETRFIEALENDDYSVFAGSAYLYGYMRAYVKFLGLPLDEFIADLESIEDANEPHFEHINYESAAKSKAMNWMLPAILGFLLLVIIVVVVLVNRDDSSIVESLSSNIGIGNNSVQNMRSIPIPLNENTQADIQTVEPDSFTSDANADIEAVHNVSLNQNAPSNTGISKLLLEYKTDSWTDIRDAEGKRLVYRMVEKGNRLQLDSSPSYSILLGYSPGVKVFWNDQPFNLTSHERENIAYFVVGKKEKISSVAKRTAD